MVELIKTKGIVLHVMPIKEHDKRIVLFSKEYGKMVVFANGAKRAKSPLLAGTQPFVFGEFFLHEGTNSYTLRQVNVLESFYELRLDMNDLAYGLYCLEVMNHIVQEMDPNEDLLRLLYVTLMAVKKKQNANKVIKTVFEFRILNMIGFAPDLSGCMECGKNTGEFVLSHKGGLICSECMNHDHAVVDGDDIKVLRHLQSTPLKSLYHFKMDQNLFERIKKPLHQYFEHFVPHQFKSLEIIQTEI